MTDQAKPAFDQEVLDQIAIFNEIIEYIKSHAITKVETRTNQYFETVDFKYEYVDRNLSITVKPTSEIYPKIQSLKPDILNKFDVQITNADEMIDIVKRVIKMYPDIKLLANGATLNDVNDMKYALLQHCAGYSFSKRSSSTKIASIHLYTDSDALSSILLQYFLNRLTSVNTDISIQHESYIDTLSIVDGMGYRCNINTRLVKK